MGSYKAIIKNFVIKTLLKLSGMRAWVASFFFNYVWKQITIILKSFKTSKEVTDDFKKYKEEINKPGASADDVRDSFDHLNRS